jgi:hypothetical protein
MAKPKRKISGNAMLRRKEYLTGTDAKEEKPEQPPEDETAADTPPPAEVPAAAQEYEQPPEETADDVQEQDRAHEDGTRDEPEEQEAEHSGEHDDKDNTFPMRKRRLQDHFLEAKKDDVTADTFYLPNELYDAVRVVWNARKREVKRGYKKSHLIIESLLRHPDIVEELKRSGLLKS